MFFCLVAYRLQKTRLLFIQSWSLHNLYQQRLNEGWSSGFSITARLSCLRKRIIQEQCFGFWVDYFARIFQRSFSCSPGGLLKIPAYSFAVLWVFAESVWLFESILCFYAIFRKIRRKIYPLWWGSDFKYFASLCDAFRLSAWHFGYILFFRMTLPEQHFPVYCC